MIFVPVHLSSVFFFFFLFRINLVLHRVRKSSKSFNVTKENSVPRNFASMFSSYLPRCYRRTTWAIDEDDRNPGCGRRGISRRTKILRSNPRLPRVYNSNQLGRNCGRADDSVYRFNFHRRNVELSEFSHRATAPCVPFTVASVPFSFCVPLTLYA